MAAVNGIQSGSDLQEARQHMREEGWCVIPDILSKIETQNVLDQLWSTAEGARKRGEDTFLPFLDPNESEFRLSSLLIDL